MPASGDHVDFPREYSNNHAYLGREHSYSGLFFVDECVSFNLHPWTARPPRRLPTSDDHVFSGREYSDDYKYFRREHSDSCHSFFDWRLYPRRARPPGRLPAANVREYFARDYSDFYLPFTDYAAASLHSGSTSSSWRLSGGGRGVFDYHEEVSDCAVGMFRQILALTQPTQYHDDAHARISADGFHHEQRLLHSPRPSLARRLRYNFFRYLDTQVKFNRDI